MKIQKHPCGRTRNRLWGSRQERVLHQAPQTVLVLLHSFFLLTWVWNAQAGQGNKQDEQSKPEVTVNIGISTAKPGEQIQIPLTLSGPEQTPIGSLVEEITFPKDALQFVATETGLAADISDAEIKAVAKSDSNLTVLEVTVSAKQALKAGILAYLNLNVPADAKKGSIPIKARSSKAASVEGTPIPLGEGKDGEVTVFDTGEEIPVLGCFFFTH